MANEQESSNDRLVTLEKRIQMQNDELTVLKASLADALRRLQKVEEQQKHQPAANHHPTSTTSHQTTSKVAATSTTAKKPVTNGSHGPTPSASKPASATAKPGAKGPNRASLSTKSENANTTVTSSKTTTTTTASTAAVTSSTNDHSSIEEKTACLSIKEGKSYPATNGTKTSSPLPAPVEAATNGEQQQQS